MAFNPFQQSNARLYVALLTFTILISFPSGYQMTYLNQPAHLFRAWLDRATNHRYTPEKITWIWSVLVSLRIVGNVVGAIGSAVLADNVGRRDTIRISAVPLALGDALSFTSIFFDSVICMAAGRLITGIGDGMAANILKTFFVEVTPASVRGKVGVFLMFVREIGMLIAIFLSGSNVFGTPELLPYIFLVPVIIVAPAPFILAIFPRSPRFLYTTAKDPEGAMSSLQYYQGANNEMWSILDAYGMEVLTRTKLKISDIWRDRSLRKSFGLAICFGLALTFGGRFVCLNYSADLFRESGLDKQTAEKTTLVAQAFGFPAILFTMFSTDRLGRRPIFMVASMIVLLLQSIAMVCYFTMDRTEMIPFALTVAVSMCIGLWVPVMIGGMAGLNFVPAELFPQRARSIGNAVFISVLYGVGSISTTVFPIVRHLKIGCGMLFMVIPLLISTIILYFFLPETSQRTVESIGGANETVNEPEDYRLNSFKQKDYGANVG